MLSPVLLDKTRGIQVLKFLLLILKIDDMIRSPPILVILFLPSNPFSLIFCSVLDPRRLTSIEDISQLVLWTLVGFNQLEAPAGD